MGEHDWNPLTTTIEGDRLGPHGPTPDEPTRPVLQWREVGDGCLEAALPGGRIYRYKDCSVSVDLDADVSSGVPEDEAACERAALRILREALEKLEGR